MMDNGNPEVHYQTPHPCSSNALFRSLRVMHHLHVASSEVMVANMTQQGQREFESDSEKCRQTEINADQQ